jgi:hypothetical protein
LTLKLGVSEHNLPNPSKSGELTIEAEDSAGSKALMEMVFHCSDLEIKDLLSKSVSLRFIFLLGTCLLMLPLHFEHAYLCFSHVDC